MRLHRGRTAAMVMAASIASGGLIAVPSSSAAPNSRAKVAGTVPAWANSANFKGAVPGSDHVGFRVYLGWASDPSALIQAVSTPGSRRYGHYLSAAQFRTEFSPSQSQDRSVQQWLRSQGFTVDYTPGDNLYVAAEGTVAQANSAFGTTLGEYGYEGLTLRSPEQTLSVPASLGVQSVVGLDDSAALVHTDISPSATPSPGYRNGGPCSEYWGQKTTQTTQEPTPLKTTTTKITSPAAVTLPDAYSADAASGGTKFAPCGYTPDQLRGAYGLSASNTGAGQTVAIIDAYASPTIVSDANTYFKNHNVGSLIPPLTGSDFRQVVAPGTYHHPEEGQKQSPQSWYGEETLDVEAVHTMAPDSNIVFVGAPNNFQDLDAALLHVVDNQLATLVTNSYGWSGEDLPVGYIKPFYDIMQQAAAEGIGVYFSSGDNGDETGGSGVLAQATPDWPASSPLVTAVGGTSLAVGDSASRVGEWGWETGISHLAGTDATDLSWTPAPPGAYDYGAGGGTSRIFAQPSYQQGVVPTSMSEIYGNSTPMRVVPDVSAIADPSTGMLVGQTQAFPKSAYYPSGDYYSEYRIGGTSLASPLFTGMMADAQAAAGRVIGFANPLLYSQAQTPGAFKDIVAPSTPLALVRSDFANTVDPTAGYAASVRAIDYDAPLTIHVEPGYDDVTGIGSPGGPGFFSDLAAGA